MAHVGCWFIIYILALSSFALLCDFSQAEINTERKIKGKQTWKHIESILELDSQPGKEYRGMVLETQDALLKIYRESIKPLGAAYHFSDLNRNAISEGEIFANPMILFLGPWSTGKSSIISYLLGLEESTMNLFTGAEPTTTDFVVLMNGPTHRIAQGMQLVSDKTKHYSPLQKFGMKFLERFQGIEMPSELLERVTLVDTPGIIENKKQQQRGYPFNNVCQWFIDRSHLVFLVFDPTKLDFGSELTVLFNQLKGHEAKLRIILNKADTVTRQELMRVYGALFWSLSPLVHEVEPPRVYVVSLWSKPYVKYTNSELFYEEECSLITDIQEASRYQLERKISAIRHHAFLVLLHALTVDAYLQAYEENESWFSDNNKLWIDILHNPKQYKVHTRILSQHDFSVHDLPTAETYQEFFTEKSRDSFKRLEYYCPFFSDCAVETLIKAIDGNLVNLLSNLRPPSLQCSKDSNLC